MSKFSFRLSPHYMSDIIWRQIFEGIEPEIQRASIRIEDIFAACNATRSKMAYNTGTISVASALCLYAVTRFVRPTTIFEVGTFIGNSTLSMAAAMDINEAPNSRIFTCDGSNDTALPLEKVKTPVTAFPKTLSHDALGQLAVAPESRNIDFLHIDGRIGERDMGLFPALCDPQVVVALDDFEGGEKGVVNWNILRQHEFFKHHALVHPAPERLMTQIGSRSFAHSVTALLIPVGKLVVTAQ